MKASHYITKGVARKSIEKNGFCMRYVAHTFAFVQSYFWSTCWPCYSLWPTVRWFTFVWKLCRCILETSMYIGCRVHMLLFINRTHFCVLLREAKWQNAKIKDIFKTVSALCKVLLKKGYHSLGSVWSWHNFFTVLLLVFFLKNTPLCV